MKEIELTKGFKTFVDDDDYEWLSANKWHSSIGYAGRAGKRVDCWRQSHIFMHREVLKRHFGWTCLDGFYVDHINGNRSDNRKENLRRCTNQQNQFNTNKHKRNTSGYKGVSWNIVDKKWQVYLKTKDKVHFLGQFHDVKKAAEAYDKAAIKIHGEFSNINFKEGLSHL